MMKPVQRNSVFEIAKLLCMVAIVFGHLSSQGRVQANSEGLNQVFNILFGNGQRIAVNLFIMLGAFFMTEKKLKLENVLKIYGELWLYTVGVTLILALCGYTISFKDYLTAFLPFTRLALWYISAHITLLLLSPYLQKAFEMEKKQLGFLVGLLFFITSVFSMFHMPQDTWMVWVGWFVFIFLFIGYDKKYPIFPKFRKSYMTLISGLLIYFIFSGTKLALAEGLFSENRNLVRFISRTVEWILSDCKTLPNFASAFLLYMFCQTRRQFSVRWINYLSTSTLAVYILHQVPAFWKILWYDLFCIAKWYKSPYLFLYEIAIVALIFIISAAIDKLRINYVEPLVMNCRPYKLFYNYLRHRIGNQIINNSEK